MCMETGFNPQETRILFDGAIWVSNRLVCFRIILFSFLSFTSGPRNINAPFFLSRDYNGLEPLRRFLYFTISEITGV